MSIYALNKTLADLTGDNVIDSRDLDARAREIEDDLEAIEGDREEGVKTADPGDEQELRDELAELKALIDEIEGYSGDMVKDGVTLVAEHYWVEYAQELADDIGAVDRNASWPNTYIDWDRAADALKQDYTSVDIGGTDYWFR